MIGCSLTHWARHELRSPLSIDSGLDELARVVLAYAVQLCGPNRLKDRC